jgi:hypothetical protein
MKINYELIEKIFNLKLKLTLIKDKEKISKYEDYIPMYDIYSQQIYPINKINIHYRLIECHYRFVNIEVYNWIKILYNKYKYKHLENNLKIMSNYDLNILINTSYKALYKFSPSLGLLVSICKRNSFHPFIFHLKPYYSKLELIKLGQNMQIINTNINLEELVNHELHYDLCKKVSFNDVSFDEILRHHNYIIENNCIGWICFYSFFGSFLYNNYLRSNSIINSQFYIGLSSLIKIFNYAPKLDNDYYIYRFIWNDKFIETLKVGDIFMDNGFMSATRDPFYSPGLSGSFGLILIKIKIPKNKLGIGLFIENFSLFPKEEEFLLTPFSKFKLLSQDNNFKYYHTNKEFEKLINKKYEFEYIGFDNYLLQKLEKKINNIKFKYKSFNIIDININGIDRISIIKKFIATYSSNYIINLKLKNKLYIFNYQWFDSSRESSYEKLYYNKIKDGMLLSIFNSDGYPVLNIELGNKMVINFLNQFYLANEIQYMTNNILELIYQIARIFNYSKVMIFHEYESFSIFKENYNKSHHIFLYTNLFNKFIYKYLKNNNKFHSSNPYISYDVGYWFLDSYFNKPIPDNIINKIPQTLKNLKTIKSLFIKTIEHHFNFYNVLINLLDPKIFDSQYVIYNVFDRLVAENLIENFKPNIGYSDNNYMDENYKLIFRQSFRRI